MMLEAADIGIGTTWVMLFEPKKIKKEFSLEDNIKPVALLVAGYPAEDAKPSRLHSSFRKPDDMILYK